MTHVGPAPEAVPTQPDRHGPTDRRDAIGEEGVPGVQDVTGATDRSGSSIKCLRWTCRRPSG